MKTVILSLTLAAFTLSFSSAAHAYDKSGRAASASLNLICEGLEKSIAEAAEEADEFASEGAEHRAAAASEIAEELSEKYEDLKCDQRIAKEKSLRASDIAKCEAITEAASQLEDEPQGLSVKEAVIAKASRTKLKSQALLCRAVLN